MTLRIRSPFLRLSLVFLSLSITIQDVHSETEVPSGEPNRTHEIELLETLTNKQSASCNEPSEISKSKEELNQMCKENICWACAKLGKEFLENSNSSDGKKLQDALTFLKKAVVLGSIEVRDNLREAVAQVTCKEITDKNPWDSSQKGSDIVWSKIEEEFEERKSKLQDDAEPLTDSERSILENPGCVEGGECDCNALYYVATTSRAFIEAAQCAGSGEPSVVAQLYANGKGTDQNIDKALWLICTDSTRSQAEVWYMVDELLNIKNHQSKSEFQYCEHVTSSSATAACAKTSAVIESLENEEKLKTLLASWTDEQRKEKEILDKAFEEFSRSDDEAVDASYGTGTMRVARVINAEQLRRFSYLTLLKLIDSCDGSKKKKTKDSISFQELKLKVINSFQKRVKLAQDEEEVLIKDRYINGLKNSQKSWELFVKATDQFVKKFVSQKIYPVCSSQARDYLYYIRLKSEPLSID